MKDLTIVTSVTPKYEKKLILCLPTWRKKPQITDSKLIIFYNGYEKLKDNLLDLKKYFDISFIKWDMNEYGSERELMLSSFVLGSKYIKTKYWVKIDADTFFVNSKDVFCDDDFKYDLVGHRWGYTKPAKWLNILEEWAESNSIPGERRFLEEIPEGKNTYGHKRIASFFCLHSTDFTNEASLLAGKRLPIPSHDTYLWYMANRLQNRSWKRKNFKKLGVGTNSRYRRISKILGKIYTGEKAIKSSRIIEKWERKYKYNTNQNILDKIQIELTTDCNLKCYNCDRSCRQAPSKENISLSQIKSLVDESINFEWKWNRIDIIGGEPTLHPELTEIIEEIKRYKLFYNRCKVRLSTNGLGSFGLSSIPKWIRVRNSSKNNVVQNHSSYNLAPLDYNIYDSENCDIPWRCGIGFSRYGYFLCGAGAGLSRVYGFDIGIKTLKEVTFENLISQRMILCGFCGHSMTTVRKRIKEEEKSSSWEEAYEKYQKNVKKMSLVYEKE